MQNVITKNFFRPRILEYPRYPHGRYAPAPDEFSWSAGQGNCMGTQHAHRRCPVYGYEKGRNDKRGTARQATACGAGCGADGFRVLPGNGDCRQRMGRTDGGDDRSARPGSVEATLHQEGTRNQLLIFDPNDAEDRFRKVLPHRAIGVVYRPKGKSSATTCRLCSTVVTTLFCTSTVPRRCFLCTCIRTGARFPKLFLSGSNQFRDCFWLARPSLWLLTIKAGVFLPGNQPELRNGKSAFYVHNT